MDDLFDSLEDGADAFFTNLTGKKPDEAAAENLHGNEPADGAHQEAPVEGAEGDTTGEAEEGSQEAPVSEEEASGEGEGTQQQTDPDDAEFELTIADKVEKAKLRDLKASYLARAQSEAAQRDYAERRQAIEATFTQANAVLNAEIEAAKKELEPYTKLDYVVLQAQGLDVELLQQLRANHAAAIERVKRLETGGAELMRSAQEANAVEIRKAAEASVRELSDPKTGIKGFGKELFGKMIEHATTYGIPRQMIEMQTHPGIWRLVNDAMSFRAGADAVDKVITKVVNKPKSPTLKPSNAPGKAPAVAKGLNKLKQTGSMDDATDAFLEHLKSSAGPAND